MTEKQKGRPIGERVHAWLSEPEGATFTYGKWRFWFVAVAGLQLLNALLTALIFQSSGNLQNYMGAVLLGVGALVGWLALGALHYSDASDRKLARGVSALDSLTLLFVIAHFAFLMWTYGHLKTIQSAEAKYDLAAEVYNAKAEKIQTDNVKIAEAIRDGEKEKTKAEKLKNDTAYQDRKAAEAGGYHPGRRQSPAAPVSPSLATSQVELEKPVKPEKTAAQFLTEWDAWIRAANFGELLLCALTLIFIRNRTAQSNSPRPSLAPIFDAPLSRVYRSPIAAANFTKKKETAKEHAPSVSVINPEGLERLREALRVISFRLPGFSFKAQVKGDAIWILMVRANKGTQETVASKKATFKILDAAMKMDPEKFRRHLETFLIENGFEL